MSQSALEKIIQTALLVLTPLCVGIFGTYFAMYFIRPPVIQNAFALEMEDETDIPDVPLVGRLDLSEASSSAEAEMLSLENIGEEHLGTTTEMQGAPSSAPAASLSASATSTAASASTPAPKAATSTTAASPAVSAAIGPVLPASAPSSAQSSQPSSSTPQVQPASTGFKLNVPYFAQQYVNSCEAAALRMALAFKGVLKNSDIEIISAMGYNPRPKDTVNNIWDDPQEMYVGEVDVVDISKGYGVYGKPVAKAAQAFGRQAEYTNSMTASRMAREISNGNPVILWGYTSLTGEPYTWTTPAGKTVKAFRGEHARVVVGFEGTIENPTGFYVHDSTTGKQNQYWSSNVLMAQFHAIPEVTNQAVIVR